MRTLVIVVVLLAAGCLETQQNYDMAAFQAFQGVGAPMGMHFKPAGEEDGWMHFDFSFDTEDAYAERGDSNEEKTRLKTMKRILKTNEYDPEAMEIISREYVRYSKSGFVRGERGVVYYRVRTPLKAEGGS